jgi:uncharacterized protein (TIGR02453 family)
MHLEKSTLQFFLELNENNHKEWFDLNRKSYELAKKDFAGFVDAWIAEVNQYDFLGELVAKDVMFRINRDVRFSKNKAPYKVNISAALAPGGKKSTAAPYYLHVEPGGNSFLAGGCYMPMAEELSALRQEIDYNSSTFLGIIEGDDFKRVFKKLEGEKLKNKPKGYEDTNVMIEYLKFKSMTVSVPISDEELTSGNLLKLVVGYSKVMFPFLHFLREATKPVAQSSL